MRGNDWSRPPILTNERLVAAVTASGGLCAPVGTRYDLEVLGQDLRPPRDALTAFQATRGGIQFNRPPVLTDVLVDTAGGAITTVTVAQDTSGATKTVQFVDCGDAVEVTVRAVAERLQFSNFADRYNPERHTAWAQLTLTAHARRAEQLLLIDLAADSTHYASGRDWRVRAGGLVTSCSGRSAWSPRTSERSARNATRPSRRSAVVVTRPTSSQTRSSTATTRSR